MYERRQQRLLSRIEFSKRVGRHGRGGAWSFGLWTWRRRSRLSLRCWLELDRFPFKRLDDPRWDGSSRSVEDRLRETFCFVLRSVFGLGVHRHRISTARAICPSHAASLSRGGSRIM